MASGFFSAAYMKQVLPALHGPSLLSMLEAVEEAPQWHLITATTLLAQLPPVLVVVGMQHLFVIEGSVTPDIRFSGQICLKESLGSDTLYHIQYGPRKEPLIIRN